MNFLDKFIQVDVKKNMGIVGVTDEFFCVYLSRLLKKEKKNILVVVNSLFEANNLYSSLSNYTDKCYLFPMDDFLTSEALAISPDLQINRLETINKILKFRDDRDWKKYHSGKDLSISISLEANELLEIRIKELKYLRLTMTSGRKVEFKEGYQAYEKYIEYIAR